MGTGRSRIKSSVQEPLDISGNVDTSEQPTSIPIDGRQTHRRMGSRPMKVTQGDIGRAEGRTVQRILCNQQTPWPHAQHFSRQTHNKQQSKPRHRCQVSPGTTNTLPTTTIQRPPKQSLGKSRSRTHKHQSRSQQPDIAWRRLQFQQGSRKFLSRLSPSHQQLSNQYYTDTLQTDSYLYQRDEQAHSTSHQLLSATTRESVEMNRTLALLSEGGTGHLPTHKVSGYV